MPEDTILNIGRQKYIDFLKSFEEEDPLAVAYEPLNNLRVGESQYYDKSELQLSDLITLYQESKFTLIDYIPHYTASIQDTIALVKEIEYYYKALESYAIKVLMEIKNEQLQESLLFSNHITNSTPHIIHVYDLVSQKYVYVNQKLTDILGYTYDDFIENAKELLKRIIHPDDMDKFKNRFDAYNSLKDGEILEDLIRVKNSKGDYLYMSSRVVIFKRTKDGKPVQVLATAQDITSQIENELKLRDSEANYRFLAENSTDLITRVAPDGTFLYLSPSSEFLTGFKPEELLGKNAFDLYHPDDRAMMLDAYAKVQDLPDVATVRYRGLSKSGIYIWMESTGRIVKNGINQSVEIHASTRDITERVATEQALEKEREYLNAVLESVSEGIVSCNTTGEITYFNQVAKNFHNLPAVPINPSEWVDYYDLYHADGVTKMQIEDVPLYKALKGEEVASLQMVIAPINGIKRILLANGKKIINSNGEVLGAVVAMNDITAQKNAEGRLIQVINELTNAKEELQQMNSELEDRVEMRTSDLKESEAKYRFMAESIPVVVWTAEPNGQIDFFSNRWTEYTGLTLEDIKEEGWIMLPHPDDLQSTLHAWDKALKSNSEFKIEHRLKSKDGAYRWMLSRALPFKNPEGQLMKWFGTTIDIHDEKVWAEKLKESEERFRTMADNIPNLAWMGDETGNIFWYNQKWYEYTGTTPAEVEGWGWQSVHDPEVLPVVMEQWMASIESGKPFEMVFPIRGANGVYRPFLTRVLPVRDSAGKIVRWFGSNTDIYVERQREESLLMQSRVLESMNEGVSVTDENGIILYTNAAEDRMFGYDSGELIGKHVSVQNDYSDADNIKIVSEVIAKLKSDGYWQGKWNNIKKDGTLFYTYAYISTLSLETRNLFVCVQRDITEELKNKEALEYQSSLNKTIADNTTSALFMINERGYCTFINPAAERIFGYSFEEISQYPLHDMIHHHKHDGSVYPKEECPLDWKLPENFDIKAHEDVFFNKNGCKIPVSCAASPIFENGMPISTLLEVRDITAVKRAQEEIIQRNQELEKINNDLDNFIYTASHDLKSPVSNIEGLVHAIKDCEQYHHEEIKPLVDMMAHSVEKFKRTIIELTDISRIQKAVDDDIEDVDLEALMEEIMFSEQNQIKSTGAHILMDFEAVKSLKFSRKNCRSMLYNLLSNAIKYHVIGRTPEIYIKTERQGDFVKLTVKDNGMGINAKDLNKIFMMFKRIHTHVDGTGVGLYIVKRILENAGGRIDVESEEGICTTFTLYIKSVQSP